MDLKQYLKIIKMNESRISAIVGGLIIAVIAVMVFNYFKNIDSGITTPNSISTENATISQSNYVVERGDSLWSIAEDKLGDGFRWKEIAEVNDLPTDTTLRAGQELKLPSQTIAEADTEISEPVTETIVATTEPEVVVTPSPVPSITPVAASTTKLNIPDSSTSYTVVKGDNLWNIAVATYGDGFRWTDIAQANKLENPRVIHAGNVLVLPR
jgi:5'-nucleotidase